MLGAVCQIAMISLVWKVLHLPARILLLI